MRCGDSVFLWRSEGVGENASDAGVVAYAEIISDVSLMPEEPESVQFWRDTSKLGIAQSRVWLNHSCSEIKRGLKTGVVA